MQYTIDTVQAVYESRNLESLATKLDLEVLSVSALYALLRLVGDPSVQTAVRLLQRQNAAVLTESHRLRMMGSALGDAAKTYSAADTKVADTAAVRGSVIEGSMQSARHQASGAEMDETIASFEREHPEDSARLNALLASGQNNQLTEDDIRKIKYLLYTANEPYRTIYLNSLGNYTIGDADMNGGAYYQPSSRTINFTYPECFGSDPRGEYTTFFHESGHGVDDTANLVNQAGFDTDTYTVYNETMGREVTLRDAIEYDVYYNENNPHSVTSLANRVISEGGYASGGNIDNVINALKNGSSDGLNLRDRALYNAVVNRHQAETGGAASMEAVTDVYGGISRNALQNQGKHRQGYTHGDSYWNDQSMTNKELWAEYFSYNMAGDTEALNNLREYFPEAAGVLDQYAQNLAGQT